MALLVKVGLTMRSPESEQQREQQRGERSAGRFAGRSAESQGRSGEGQERSDAPVQARARRAPRGKTSVGSKHPLSSNDTTEGLSTYELGQQKE